MQALAWLLCDFGKLLEPNGGVDQIAENKPCSFRLTAEKQRCRFIEKRLGKLGIALNAGCSRLLHTLARVIEMAIRYP